MHRNFGRNVVWGMLVGAAMLVPPRSYGVREASANANMMIRRHLRDHAWGKAALWQEAAARAFDLISAPINRTVMEYCERHGRRELLEELQRYQEESARHRQTYLEEAQKNRARADSDPSELAAEQRSIEAFFVQWVPHYPDHFYDFGFYRRLFGEAVAERREAGRIGEALRVEAEAAELCARQYQDVVVGYFLGCREAGAPAPDGRSWEELIRHYRGARDRQLARAARLRDLARKDPEVWPEAAERSTGSSTPAIEPRMAEDDVVAVAKGHPRIREVLKRFPESRTYAFYQGALWTVSLYAAGWNHLGIAFVDDARGEVEDVLITGEGLEAWSEERESAEERQAEWDQAPPLRLSENEVNAIVRRVPAARQWRKAHPEGRFVAEYNRRWRCWIVELVEAGREHGLVSVRDEDGTILEIDVPTNRKE